MYLSGVIHLLCWMGVQGAGGVGGKEQQLKEEFCPELSLKVVLREGWDLDLMTFSSGPGKTSGQDLVIFWKDIIWAKKTCKKPK